MEALAALVLGACLILAMPGKAEGQGVIDRYSLGRGDATQVDLPRALREASGLAISAEGRFFTHGDEEAEVVEIDPASGRAVRTFALGDRTARGDFEGIAIAGSRFFLVTSAGGIVEFAAGADGERVPYFTHRGLPDEDCEVEGLEYDARSDALLLACKTPHRKPLRSRLVIFAFSLASMRAEPEPRMALGLDFLEDARLGNDLSPSGIAIHPTAGTLFVLAAREHLLVEISADGSPLGARSLSHRVHKQPEGIGFTPDGTLWIADEGGNGRASLTRYVMNSATDRL
jgi:uncharacterized protein YjiK